MPLVEFYFFKRRNDSSWDRKANLGLFKRFYWCLGRQPL